MVSSGLKFAPAHVRLQTSSAVLLNFCIRILEKYHLMCKNEHQATALSAPENIEMQYLHFQLWQESLYECLEMFANHLQPSMSSMPC